MIRFASKFSALMSPAVLAGMMILCVPARAAPPPPVSDDDDAPPSVSRPVVEPTAPSAGKALNAALVRLAKDPRNIDALVDAGNAAIALGDNEAALGFFTRADQIAPANATVKAAIAGARLHLDDPVEALRWYAAAEQVGGDAATFALDRGLAFDLVGDNANAVAQYRIVLARSNDAGARDEATRRQAISLAIGGDRRGAELALLPLLQRQDRPAWRAHVFVLAIAGRVDDAVSVTRATMPADLASAIDPYLRFMAQLTPAQQAAVASLGRFPRAADIGRDDPRVVAYAAAHPRVPLTPAAPPQALAQAAPVSDSARARRRKGHDVPAAPVTTPVQAPAQPDIVLPPPPPPPTALAYAGPPNVPVASRTTTPDTAPPLSPLVPQPTVLSRLDMPSGHHGGAGRVAPNTVGTPPPSIPLAMAAPPPAAPVPDGSGIATVALPASTVATVPQPVPTSHPVVEPIPDRPVPARPEPVAAPHTRAHAEKAAHGDAASDHPAVVKDKDSKEKESKEKDVKGKAAHAKAGKGKAPDDEDDDTQASKTRGGKDTKGKSAHGKAAKDTKAAKDDDAEAALEPCKPVTTGKGRKAKAAAAKAERSRAAKAKAGHHGKGHKDSADSETCAPVTHGERPDGPGGVSRDSDSDDDAKTAKAKAKGKGHDKATESEKGSEKAGVKGGKHARYASRIWVEVLTGSDRDKMPAEWRSLVHKARKLKGHKPYLTPWHSNFRLLTGPFDSDADAQDFIAELRKDGVSGFEWTSPAGQAVDSLPLP